MPLTSARLGCLAGLLAGASLVAKPEPKAEVIMNVTMTEAGRKISRPTPEHPVFYVPVIAGWQELGRIIGREEAPPQDAMLRLIHRELAKQGYVFVPDPNVKPSLLLVFEWGYLNPVTSDSGATTAEDAADEVTFNAREMRHLIFGESANNAASIPPTQLDQLLASAGEDRYFVIVTAFDFAAAQKMEKKPLWRARMSTPRQGVWLSDVMSALITSGAPFFGRETTTPQITIAPQLRKGRIEIGTPTVVGDHPAAPVPVKPTVEVAKPSTLPTR